MFNRYMLNEDEFLAPIGVKIHPMTETIRIMTSLKQEVFQTLIGDNDDLIPYALYTVSGKPCHFPIAVRYIYPDGENKLLLGEPAYLQSIFDGDMGEVMIVVPSLNTILVVGSPSFGFVSYETYESKKD